MTVGPHMESARHRGWVRRDDAPGQRAPRQRDDQQRAWPYESLVSGSHRAGT
jgi:hypothetical protein